MPFGAAADMAAPCGIFYLLQDHLKSSRSFVNQSGATLANNYIITPTAATAAAPSAI